MVGRRQGTQQAPAGLARHGPLLQPPRPLTSRLAYFSPTTTASAKQVAGREYSARLAPPPRPCARAGTACVLLPSARFTPPSLCPAHPHSICGHGPCIEVVLQGSRAAGGKKKEDVHCPAMASLVAAFVRAAGLPVRPASSMYKKFNGPSVLWKLGGSHSSSSSSYILSHLHIILVRSLSIVSSVGPGLFFSFFFSLASLLRTC